jgi:hypothetical protein
MPREFETPPMSIGRDPACSMGRRYGPGTHLALHSGDSFEIDEYEVHVALTLPGARYCI